MSHDFWRQIVPLFSIYKSSLTYHRSIPRFWCCQTWSFRFVLITSFVFLSRALKSKPVSFLHLIFPSFSKARLRLWWGWCWNLLTWFFRNNIYLKYLEIDRDSQLIHRLSQCRLHPSVPKNVSQLLYKAKPDATEALKKVKNVHALVSLPNNCSSGIDPGSNTQIIQGTISKHHPLCERRKTSTFEYKSLETAFMVIKCFEVWIAVWMDTTTNIFSWISRLTTILPRCRGSPKYQVQSKIAGIEILVISETWFSIYHRQPQEVFLKI